MSLLWLTSPLAELCRFFLIPQSDTTAVCHPESVDGNEDSDTLVMPQESLARANALCHRLRLQQPGGSSVCWPVDDGRRVLLICLRSAAARIYAGLRGASGALGLALGDVKSTIMPGALPAEDAAHAWQEALMAALQTQGWTRLGDMMLQANCFAGVQNAQTASHVPNPMHQAAACKLSVPSALQQAMASAAGGQKLLVAHMGEAGLYKYRPINIIPSAPASDIAAPGPLQLQHVLTDSALQRRVLQRLDEVACTLAGTQERVFVLGLRAPAEGEAERMRTQWLARCGIRLPENLTHVFEVAGSPDADETTAVPGCCVWEGVGLVAVPAAQTTITAQDVIKQVGADLAASSFLWAKGSLQPIPAPAVQLLSAVQNAMPAGAHAAAPACTGGTQAATTQQQGAAPPETAADNAAVLQPTDWATALEVRLDGFSKPLKQSAAGSLFGMGHQLSWGANNAGPGSMRGWGTASAMSAMHNSDEYDIQPAEGLEADPHDPRVNGDHDNGIPAYQREVGGDGQWGTCAAGGFIAARGFDRTSKWAYLGAEGGVKGNNGGGGGAGAVSCDEVSVRWLLGRSEDDTLRGGAAARAERRAAEAQAAAALAAHLQEVASKAEPIAKAGAAASQAHQPLAGRIGIAAGLGKPSALLKRPSMPVLGKGILSKPSAKGAAGVGVKAAGAVKAKGAAAGKAAAGGVKRAAAAVAGGDVAVAGREEADGVPAAAVKPAKKPKTAAAAGTAAGPGAVAKPPKALKAFKAAAAVGAGVATAAPAHVDGSGPTAGDASHIAASETVPAVCGEGAGDTAGGAAGAAARKRVKAADVDLAGVEAKVSACAAAGHVSGLSLPEMQAWLRARKLPVGGRKADVEARVAGALGLAVPTAGPGPVASAMHAAGGMMVFE